MGLRTAPRAELSQTWPLLSGNPSAASTTVASGGFREGQRRTARNATDGGDKQVVVTSTSTLSSKQVATHPRPRPRPLVHVHAHPHTRRNIDT